MITDLDFDDSLKMPRPLYIDVRSEREYQEDHIPHSLNIPVFNDEERIQVGLIYKNEGPEKARKAGLNIVAPKLPQLVKTIEEAALGKQLILYCWRGGLRSYSLATILDLMNIRVFRLKGGYKRYRQWINNYFQQERFSFEVIVIHGLTGTGKTGVIQKLAHLGAGAVDLEALANNRGSVFGNVGLEEQPSQKLFESRLWDELHKNQEKKFIIVECESKRIGKITIPLSLFRGMREGRHILLFDTIDNRVKRIISEYHVDRYGKELIEALTRLKSRLGNETVASLSQMIEKENYASAVERLLIDYYDPLYQYPACPSREYDMSIPFSDISQTAAIIQKYLSTLEREMR
ncbi:tRNA 2-selenouridine(34) synthase MnmH [Candidatus Formimonas warabiya]|uniref:tRNA 2-selenouridine(34) synthase MnmH n=2 Tax=Formimonas warabiya TaxID=1761012 RepID=A0A3G1KP23_FORW1|nr:tRNA 2-selenouridine(34) synthase MnmH [Candidatus Formimonas warabiya]